MTRRLVLLAVCLASVSASAQPDTARVVGLDSLGAVVDSLALADAARA